MKTYLLTMISIILLLTSYGQNPSFKINNRVSTIIASSTDKPGEKITKGGETKDVYKSLDIINYNYLDRTKKTKQDELTKLESELYDNSKTAEAANVFDEATIKAKSDRIKELKDQISKIVTDQDSLYYEYTKDYMNFKKSFVLNFGPLRSKSFFDIVYGNSGKTFRALGNAGLNFGNKSASLYSEIVSGNLGLFRVSLGTMISKSSSQDSATAKNEEAYQRLVSNGGNTVLNFEYPLCYLHSYNNQYNFISTLNAKGTADIPAFGTDTSKWAGSGSFGINFYGEASTSKNELSFFANFNMNMIYGTSVFRDNLGISKTNFTFGQLSAGLVFLKNFKISFIIATISSEKSLRNRNVVVGGQVLK